MKRNLKGLMFYNIFEQEIPVFMQKLCNMKPSQFNDNYYSLHTNTDTIVYTFIKVYCHVNT